MSTRSSQFGPPVTFQQLSEVCRVLGYDPAHVAAVTLESTSVLVTTVEQTGDTVDHLHPVQP